MNIYKVVVIETILQSSNSIAYSSSIVGVNTELVREGNIHQIPFY